MVDRRYTGSGLIRRRGDGAGTPYDVTLAAALGASLLHWWEPRADKVTLDGSGNVSSIAQMVSGTALVQATAGQRPPWVASVGPNNQPYIDLPTTGLNLYNVISVAAANRTGVYCVFKAPGGAALRVAAYVNGAQPYFGQNSSRFNLRANFTGGAQDPVITSPALDTAWHLGGVRPLATGALSQLDGMTTVASYTGGDTLGAIGDAAIGHGSVAGGSFAMLLLVNDATAANDIAIKTYAAARFLP